MSTKVVVDGLQRMLVPADYETVDCSVKPRLTFSNDYSSGHVNLFRLIVNGYYDPKGEVHGLRC